MEYFKSGLKTVLGAPQQGEHLSGAETVERLVPRVLTSTLLDDRRDACRALKALSRKYRIEVGAQGMDALLNVLERDSSDCEIVGYALDTLCNICSPEAFEEEERPELGHESLLHVGEQFTEMFLKHQDNVGLILSFLEEYDFKVRWPALKLLSALAINKVRDIQEIILVSPMGVSKLMDMLSDSREVIRNETLLLLIQLTKSNANIQKIVAFENAFDRMFDVIAEEGYSDGGIIVEDCLLLMLNLLRNNTSNQNFFREGSYIQKMCTMFDLPADGNEEGMWLPQKVANIHGVLQVVRVLVSPSNPGLVTSSCQKALRSSGIVQALCGILMASGVPVDVLSEAICAVGEAIRGNPSNQEFFSTVLAPFTPPREAIVVLLMSMVNEKQPFLLRCAVLYCFQCYLFKNEIGQTQLVQTLLPSSTEVSTVTCGQLLCSGLFSHDALSNWFSSVALSHALIENPVQKEQLLRVLLAGTSGGSPVSLMQQATFLLQQCGKVQSRAGLLMLLSTWLSHCPLAIKHFLSIPSSISFLTSQAGSNERDENEELVQGLCAFVMGICVLFNDDSEPSYTKENLKHLIGKRIGHEVFISKLAEVSRHEQYSKAAKQPQMHKSLTPSELLLDYEFCKLFKVLEGMIVKAVGSTDDSTEVLNGGGVEVDSESGIVGRYKELIRDQDKRLAEREAALKESETAKAELERRLQEASASLQRLYDENMLLRAQVNAMSGGDTTVMLAEIQTLRSETAMKDATIRKLEDDLRRLELEKIANHLDNTSLSGSPKTEEVQELRGELDRLTKEQESLLELLADQDKKLEFYKERLLKHGEKVEDEDELLLNYTEESNGQIKES